MILTAKLESFDLEFLASLRNAVRHPAEESQGLWPLWPIFVLRCAQVLTAFSVFLAGWRGSGAVLPT